ncbi:MAG: hypothetical protein ACON4W_05010 [Parvibaculales bacterium]
MPKQYDYESVGPDFLDDPSKCGTVRAPVSAKSEMVFEALTSEAAWKAMLPIDRAEWHGPLGKDTSRTIAAKDAEMLEQFFEWEDGRKFGFRLARGTVGILQAMAERYEVIPTSETRCEVVITFRIRTKGLAKPLAPVLHFIFKQAGRKSMKKLEQFILSSERS